MADPLSGIVVGKIANQAFETIKNARDFVPTLEKSIETSKDLDPLVEQIKGSHYSLGRPREEMERLEKYTDNKELIRKSKKLSLNLWKFLLFSGQRAKLLKQYEAFQRYLSIVQIENKRDLMEVLTHLKGNHMNQIRGLYGAPQEPEFIGMVKQFNELKAGLMKDGASVLVLTGLGGSGKTTLAKKLCWDPLIKGKFGGNIFFVTVSETPNLKNIVKTLFEHCRLKEPDFTNDEDAINRLGNLLREVGRNPILLVLDDVGPNSVDLVEKFKFQMPDYKILVTSRVGFRRFGTPCQLNPLDHDPAVSLFRHYAQLNHISSHMKDRDLVDVVLSLQSN